MIQQIKKEAAIKPESLRIAVIGCGPYARNVHLPILQSSSIEPSLLIELEGFSAKLDGLVSADIDRLLLPRHCRLGFASDIEQKERVEQSLRRQSITHAILCCEPMAHWDYLRLLSEMKIDVFCDKPIIAIPNVCLELGQLSVLRDLHRELFLRYEKPGASRLIVNLEYRNWQTHIEFIERCVDYANKFDTLPDMTSFFYSGGNWYMPEEYMTREGHPFKDGYGVLFHTGFHFVDLLAHYLDSLMTATNDQIERVELYTSVDTPLEQLGRMGYLRELPGASPGWDPSKTVSMGETSVFQSMRVITKRGRTTQVRFELQTCGLSERRSGVLPEDNYKGAGRLREEVLQSSFSPGLFIRFENYKLPSDATCQILIHQRDGDTVNKELIDYNYEKARPKGTLLLRFLFDAPTPTSIQQIKSSITLLESLVEGVVKARALNGQSLHQFFWLRL